MSISASSTSKDGVRKSSSDPYPIGGFSEPETVEVPVYGIGELNMTLTMSVADDAETGTQILMGADGTLRLWISEKPGGPTVRQLAVKVNDLVNAMAGTAIQTEEAQ